MFWIFKQLQLFRINLWPIVGKGFKECYNFVSGSTSIKTYVQKLSWNQISNPYACWENMVAPKWTQSQYMVEGVTWWKYSTDLLVFIVFLWNMASTHGVSWEFKKRKLLQTFQKMKMPASMGSLLFEMLYELLCFVRPPLNTIQNSLEIFSVQIV